jgi:Rieske Fe-S protein
VATVDIPRRAVIRGALVAAAAAVAGYAAARHSAAAGPKHRTAAANGYGIGTGAGGRQLAALGDVPPGGGLVVAADRVVLTRDGAGTVRGFSSTCTHQGCPVSGVEDGAIVCPCHGSRFDVRTGAPIQGPATRGLTAVNVVVRADSVFTA